jgi:ubiquinone/menaquinone biosynthesis C-methylase UbiE
MSQEVSSAPGNESDGRIAYVHPTTSLEHRRLERRTAANAAAFFLPHLRPGMRLLDCGCGPGSITTGLAEAVAPGEVVGIDRQVAQVERARAMAAERGIANIHFEVGSVYDVPFPNNTFDAVFANTLLLHLAEPVRALQEMKRVLKSGGIVGIADDDFATKLLAPESPAVTDLVSLLLRVVEHHGGDPYRARHHRRLLLEAGFTRPIAGATLGTVGAWGTADETRTLAAWMADQARQPAFANLVIEQGWTDQASLESMIAGVLAWGEQPDALWVVTGVTAVGWRDDHE